MLLHSRSSLSVGSPLGYMSLSTLNLILVVALILIIASMFAFMDSFLFFICRVAPRRSLRRRSFALFDETTILA